MTDARANAIDELEQVRSAYRALFALQTLHHTPEYRANSEVLYSYLIKIGVGGARQDMQADLRFLEEGGLVRFKYVDHHFVVELTASGEDVALGRCVVDGVSPPSGT